MTWTPDDVIWAMLIGVPLALIVLIVLVSIGQAIVCKLWNKAGEVGEMRERLRWHEAPARRLAEQDREMGIGGGEWESEIDT